MARKKITIEEVPEEAPVVIGPTELEVCLAREAELRELRNKLDANGIDSIGKLDAVLGGVLKRISELS